MPLQIDNIREYLHLMKDKELKEMFSEIPINELIGIWESLTENEELKIFSLLTLEQKVNLIGMLSPNRQESLISSLSAENIKILLQEMEPDDLTDFIQAVSQEVREAVWKSLSEEARKETQMLLRFDEDDAAGIMTPRYLAISGSLTVTQALVWIRKSARNVETVYSIYIVDPLKRLRGVVSLRDVLAADDSELIENIMVKKVITVNDDTDQEDVAKILEANDLLAVPVVDMYNRLLGIVTFDDIIDVIREEQTEDLYKMGAMTGGTEKYLDSSVWHLIKKRIPWLGFLLLAATLTTNVLSHFEHLFVAATVLTLFIPTIIGTGGNSGTQSSTLVIRGLATGNLQFSDIGRVLLKEIAVGFILGLCMGVLIFARSIILPPNISMWEAASVGFALSFVVLFATLVGAFFPLAIHRLGLDPAVMAGPLMSTIIDIAGLTIYFLIAKLLLRL